MKSISFLLKHAFHLILSLFYAAFINSQPFSVFMQKRLVHCPDYFGYSYRTSFNRSPHAGARKPALSRFFALRSSVINAISRFPIPTSTSVPVRIRTMWYRKTGSGIGNDKNPVFLAEINSGNRPYCRFFHTFVGTEAPEIIRSDKRFRCFFHFFHIERCFRKIHVISARKHAFCHQSRYGIRMFCPPHSDGCGSAPASARGW